MTPVARTPLDAWIASRIGLTCSEPLTPERLARYQLDRLNRSLSYAAGNSPFYRRQWGNHAIGPLTHLDQLNSVPFTTDDALRRTPMQLLGVSQGEVARIVTLQTSGTTGDPKRIFFGDADLDHTIDFFHHGMSTLVRPGQRVLILLPGELPDSVGALLRTALARMDATGLVHGPVRDPAHTIQVIIDHEIEALVGIPVQVLALARHPHGARIPADMIQSVLLSTDYVPQAIVEAIRASWGCAVFQHYGMTEMGYGGGVACAAHRGYHLREADLLFEVIDPITGNPLGDGQLGEVVFTTLTRRAMPLIRYRTGDLAAWIDEPCPCGSTLHRLGWVQGRRREMIRLADGVALDKRCLDEALFALPDVIDFQATLRRTDDNDHLHVTLFAPRGDDRIGSKAAAALARIPAIRAAQTNRTLVLAPVRIEKEFGPFGGAAKRKIIDQRP
jgi:phenylacetate-coenzyme A ligase PaaK-like adenylate-forming protein